MLILSEFIHTFSKSPFQNLTVYFVEIDNLILKSYRNKNGQSNQETLDMGELTLPDGMNNLLNYTN